MLLPFLAWRKRISHHHTARGELYIARLLLALGILGVIEHPAITGLRFSCMQIEWLGLKGICF